MAQVWWVNDAYTHGFLVFPITIWLSWEKRGNLSKLYPTPEPLALIFTFLVSCLWLISALIDIKVIMQLSMISIILTLLWSILGRKIFLYLLFPFLFLYFAVPLGQSLIPVLMEFTANATVYLVRLTGIPVYQEGLIFILPSGSWSVVEGCAGVRYLTASLTLGVVYSYLSYATLKKRLIFIAFSIIIPIFANSLRAFIIVMLGHFSSMELASGVDHYLYGWVLFGIVVFLLFYIGSFWRDSKGDFEENAPESDTRPMESRTGIYLMVSLVVVSLFPLLHYQLQSPALDSRQTASVIPKIDHIGPWKRQSVKQSIWQPIIHNPDFALTDIYTSNQGSIQLDIGYYHTQRDGSEAISGNNRIVALHGRDWKIISSSVVETSEFPILETTIGRLGQKLLVWQWYRIGELQTYNPYKAKIYEAYMLIFSDRTDGAFITLSTPLDEDPKAARKRLLLFYNQAIDELNRQLYDLGK
jgi:exosortase A